MRRLVVVVALLLGVALGPASVAVAQTSGSIDVSSCVPGATIPADRPANGPSPVGHCDPSDAQRAIDTAVWFWVLGLLVLVAVIGVGALVRSVRRAPVDAG